MLEEVRYSRVLGTVGVSLIVGRASVAPFPPLGLGGLQKAEVTRIEGSKLLCFVSTS